jgi:hypothetical protein
MQNPDEIMEYLADDQLKHAEAPSNQELEEIYDALVGSGSEEYRIAN